MLSLILKAVSLCLIPIGIVFYTALHPQVSRDILMYSGRLGVLLLAVVLSLGPLLKIFKVSKFLKVLNRHRRSLGISVFSCAFMHASTFVIRKGGFNAALSSLMNFRPLLTFGFVTFAVLAILCLSSNDYSIKMLGMKRWKYLHKTVYIAEFSIIMHLLLQKQAQIIYVICVFTPVLCLQALQFFKKQTADKCT